MSYPAPGYRTAYARSHTPPGFQGGAGSLLDAVIQTTRRQDFIRRHSSSARLERMLAYAQARGVGTPIKVTPGVSRYKSRLPARKAAVAARLGLSGARLPFTLLSYAESIAAALTAPADEIVSTGYLAPGFTMVQDNCCPGQTSGWASAVRAQWSSPWNCLCANQVLLPPILQQLTAAYTNGEKAAGYAVWGESLTFPGRYRSLRTYSPNYAPSAPEWSALQPGWFAVSASEWQGLQPTAISATNSGLQSIRRPVPWRLIPYLPQIGHQVGREQSARGPSASNILGMLGTQANPRPTSDSSLRPMGSPVRISDGHERRPPGRGKREVKRRTAGIMFAWRAVGQVTEFVEFIEAIYKGLPVKLRDRERLKRHKKEPSWKGKLELLYNNLDQLDVAKALCHVAYANLVVDMAYGKLGAAASRAQFKRDPHALQGGSKITGSRQQAWLDNTPEGWAEWERRQQETKGHGQLPLPEDPCGR